MYNVKPLGLNLRDSDRDVKDGFFQESINLQWRDSSLRPIPERIISSIDLTGYYSPILHKVGDENQINVLAFDNTDNGLYWIGTINDGLYLAKGTPEKIETDSYNVIKTEGLSFTVLNGLVYFMGDGSNASERYYLRIQYDLNDDTYLVKDMYAWKSLIPYYPYQTAITLTYSYSLVEQWQVFTQCGLITIRFALALKTGEVVMHSPIYPFYLYGVNGIDESAGVEQLTKGDAITNIHSFINLNLDYINTALLEEEVSAINVYASAPYYLNAFTRTVIGDGDKVVTHFQIEEEDLKGELQKQAESPYYLIKTIDSPTDDKLLLYVDSFNTRILYSDTVSKIGIESIAAGEVMPTDNFSYHYVYGKITSSNGRLIIDKPVTVLSEGHGRSLCTRTTTGSDTAYYHDNEDGLVKALAYRITDRAFEYISSPDRTYVRGLLSYPDISATYAGTSDDEGAAIRLFKTRANTAHNMACAFDFSLVLTNTPTISKVINDVTITCTYSTGIGYDGYDILTEINLPITNDFYYSSENRIQFSEIGEFSVWPAINSYRIGEGKIVFVGANNLDPANTDYIAPLIIGTTDGIYTVNFDVTGSQLIQSITKAKTLAALSSETLQIDSFILFVSDKGLEMIQNGETTNITRDYFPEYGNGDFPTQDSVYPNYNVLTELFFGGPGNPYVLGDIVEYMKGSLFAYDGRRNNIWCSNPSKNYSFVYNLKTSYWGISTYVFKAKAEFFSLLTINSDDIYSRFLVVDNSGDNENLRVLSGEDLTSEVDWHLLTRPIKLGDVDGYKKIQRMISRCELIRDSVDGYFSLGVWGKQDVNKNKVNIPMAALKDNSSNAFPSNIRQDIPLNSRKGKYKTVSVSITGKTLPTSRIEGFDFNSTFVDDNKMR